MDGNSPKSCDLQFVPPRKYVRVGVEQKLKEYPTNVWSYLWPNLMEPTDNTAWVTKDQRPRQTKEQG